MCKNDCDFEDYDVNIESDVYNNDYDDVYTGEEDEIKEQTDILFE